MPACELCWGEIHCQQIMKSCCRCNKFFHLTCLRTEPHQNTEYLSLEVLPVPWVCAPCKVNMITDGLKSQNEYSTATVSETLQIAMAINNLMNRMLKINEDFIGAQKEVQVKLFDITKKMYSAYELTSALKNCLDSLLKENSQLKEDMIRIEIEVPKPSDPAGDQGGRRDDSPEDYEQPHPGLDDLLGA